MLHATHCFRPSQCLQGDARLTSLLPQPSVQKPYRSQESSNWNRSREVLTLSRCCSSLFHPCLSVALEKPICTCPRKPAREVSCSKYLVTGRLLDRWLASSLCAEAASEAIAALCRYLPAAMLSPCSKKAGLRNFLEEGPEVELLFQAQHWSFWLLDLNFLGNVTLWEQTGNVGLVKLLMWKLVYHLLSWQVPENASYTSYLLAQVIIFAVNRGMNHVLKQALQVVLCRHETSLAKVICPTPQQCTADIQVSWLHWKHGIFLNPLNVFRLPLCCWGLLHILWCTCWTLLFQIYDSLHQPACCIMIA